MSPKTTPSALSTRLPIPVWCAGRGASAWGESAAAVPAALAEPVTGLPSVARRPTARDTAASEYRVSTDMPRGGTERFAGRRVAASRGIHNQLMSFGTTPLVARPGRRDRRHVAADLRVSELPRPHRRWSRFVGPDNDRRRLPGGVGRRDRPGAQHHGAVGTRTESGAGSPARDRRPHGAPHSGPCPAGSVRHGGQRPGRRHTGPCPAQGRGPGAGVIADARWAGFDVRTAVRASGGPARRRRRGERGRRPRAGPTAEGSGGTTGAPAGAAA